MTPDESLWQRLEADFARVLGRSVGSSCSCCEWTGRVRSS